MNVETLYKNGGVIQPNPNYNPKSKKNTQPPYILQTDLSKAQNQLSKTMYTANPLLGNTNVGDYEKYTDYGIIPNKISEDLDVELSKRQGALKQIGNSLVQAAVSEVGLGTLRSFSDIFDATIGRLFDESNDYTNPVSSALNDAQEWVRNEFAVYSDPRKNITNGGIFDLGWITSNIPSVASTLMLLLPTKGISWGASKLANLAKGTKLGAAAAKTGTRIARDIVRSQRARQTIADMAKFGAEGSLMRVMENYQESSQVYNDMLPKAIETLNGMSDHDYQEYLKQYKDKLGDINTNDRTAVAKRVASMAATTTFWDDAWNAVFDAYQLYGLRNIGRTLSNATKNSTISRLSKLQAKHPNKSVAELEQMLKARPWYKKAASTTSDLLKGGSTLITSEMTEGVEEAVNYIAQQEGMHYGDYLLGKANNSSLWGSRLKSYLAAPELWDSFFWGVVGGVAFGGIGSAYNRYATNKRREEKKQELIDKGLDDAQAENLMRVLGLSELDQRKAELEGRTTRWNKLVEDIKSINDGKAPITGETLTNEEEIAHAREKAIADYTTDLLMASMDAGHWKLTKNFLASDDLINTMVENNILTREEASVRAQQVRIQADRLDKLFSDNMRAVENAIDKAARQNKDLENVPPEILQMIVKQNMKGQINADRLEQQIKETSDRINEEEERVKADLERNNIDYDAFIKRRLYSETIGQINAEIRRLQNSKESSTLAGQMAIQRLNNRKRVIQQELNNVTSELELVERLATMLTSRRIESLLDIRQNAQNQDEYFFSTDTEDFQKLLSAVSTRDVKTLNELLDTTELTENNLDEVLNRFSIMDEAYNTLYGTSDNRTFSSLNDFSHKLYEDYHVRSGMEIQRLIELSDIVTSADEILNEIDYLSDEANAARRAGNEMAVNAFHTLARKYGTDEVRSYVESVKSNKSTHKIGLYNRLTDNEKTVLDSIIPKLGLSKVLNGNLYTRIDEALKKNDVWEYSEEIDPFVEAENSSTNQNQPQAQQSQQPTNSQGTTPRNNMGQGTGQMNGRGSNQQQTLPIKMELSYNGTTNALSITENTDSNITQNVVNTTANPDGTLTLSIKDATNVDGAFLSDSELFEGYNPSATGTMTIERNPVVEQVNGRYVVKTKGRISYSVEENDGSSSTGGVDGSEEVEIVDAAVVSSKFTEYVSAGHRKFTVSEFKAWIMTQFPGQNPVVLESNVDFVLEGFEAVGLVDDNGVIDVDNVVNRMSIYTDAYLQNKIPENKKQVTDIFEEMMAEYAKHRALDKIDGKYIISLEDLLRYCNEQSNNSNRAAMLYDTLLEIINEQNDKYFVYDAQEVRKEEMLRNAAKSVQARMDEILNGTSKPTSLAINRYVNILKRQIASATDSTIKQQLQQQLSDIQKVVDAAKPGDAITVQVQSRNKADVRTGVDFLLNGVKIGEIPLPMQTPTGFVETNDGWITDVPASNTVQSKCKVAFTRFLAPDASDTDGVAVRNALEALLGKSSITKAEADNVMSLIEKCIGVDELKKIIDTSKAYNNNIRRVNGLLKLLKWVRSVDNLAVGSVSVNSTEQFLKTLINNNRRKSIDIWFDKLRTSYQSALILTTTPVVIASVSDGGLVQTSTLQPISTAIPASVEQGNGGKPKLGIVSIIDSDVITLDDGTTMSNQLNAKSGTPFVILPGKHGTPAFVHITPRPISQMTSNTEVNGILNEVYALIDKALENWGIDNSSVDVYKLFRTIFDKNNGIFRGISVEPLGNGFTGFQLKYIDNGKTYSIEFYDKLNGNNVSNILFRSPGSRNRGIPVHKTASDVQARKTAINELKKQIREHATFYINFNNVNRAAKSSQTWTGTVNGKFIVEIPGGTRHEFDSFNDFIIGTDAIAVSTKPNAQGSSNYYNIGESDDVTDNVIITYTFNTPVSPPVEETTSLEGKSKLEQVETILDQPMAENKSLDVVKVLTTTDAFKVIAASDIFKRLNAPVVYVSDINDYDQLDKEGNPIPHPAFIGAAHKQEVVYRHKTTLQTITIPKGTIVMSSMWGNMITNSLTDRAEAFRHFIHEQIHIALSNNPNKAKILEEIGNIKQELSRAAVDNDDKLLRDWAVSLDNEEFLVESMTRPLLINLLNKIDSKNKVSNSRAKETLLERVIKCICDILGIDVRKGSLLHKEVQLLRRLGKDTKLNGRSNKTTIKRTTKRESSDATEQLLPFTDEVKTDNITETNTGEEEQVVSSTQNIEQEQDIEQEEQSTDNNSEGATSTTDTSIDNADENMENIDDDEVSLFSTVSDAQLTNSITNTQSDIEIEMQSIRNKAITDGNIILKEDGTFDYALAPNGKRSNLNERQWLQVRTKNFINWFGDWINNPTNASKVVDENGEPLVVYHGTNTNIRKFNYNGEREYNPGFFFTSDSGYASNIAKLRGEENIIIPTFLNIKNPVITTHPIVSNDVEEIFVREGDNKSDGIIGHDKITNELSASKGTEYVVINPNQIKSATDNNGDFSTKNDAISYSLTTDAALVPQEDMNKQLTIEEEKFLNKMFSTGNLRAWCN